MYYFCFMNIEKISEHANAWGNVYIDEKRQRKKGEKRGDRKEKK